MRELKKLDKVAYVRFASVYRSFEDIDEFKTLVDEVRRSVHGSGPNASSPHCQPVVLWSARTQIRKTLTDCTNGRATILAP
jgi:hypothetical protein